MNRIRIVPEFGVFAFDVGTNQHMCVYNAPTSAYGTQVYFPTQSLAVLYAKTCRQMFSLLYNRISGWHEYFKVE